MGYDPHALESDAESPALARGRLGQSSGDLVDSAGSGCGDYYGESSLYWFDPGACTHATLYVR